MHNPASPRRSRRTLALCAAGLLTTSLACGGVSEVGQRLNATFAAGELADQAGIARDRVTCEMRDTTRAFMCTATLEDPGDSDAIATALTASKVSLADALLLGDGLSESGCQPQHDTTIWFTPPRGDGYGAWWLVLSDDHATLCVASEHLYG